MTTEEIQKLREESEKRKKEERATRTSNNQRARELPLLKGTVLTFRVPESGFANDLYKVQKDGINFDYLLDSTGRKVSCKSLFVFRNNGINVTGDEKDERCDNFLARLDALTKRNEETGEIETRGEISIKVKDLRVLPSIREGWDDQRIITWEEI